MDSQIYEKLISIVGRKNVSTAMTDKITHSYDATQKRFLPDAVVYAGTTEQISQIMKLASAEKIPVLPRGAGSGTTGGTLPVEGGIVLVLTKMDTILDIDVENLVAEVEPGVITAELQRKVERLGLFYPPDPASKEFSTLGGNVAECAGGPRCVKYGVTKDYILGLEVVTPKGDVIRTGGKTMKNVAGYDLTKLFVGSEGTLGIITKIILKLLPKPEAKKTMLVQFSSIDGAANAVSAIVGAKIIPATLEFLDRSTIDCIRGKSSIPLPESCEALLIIEVDGDKTELDRQVEKIMQVIQPLGVVDSRVAVTDEESEQIWGVRRIVSPNLKKINPDKFNEDIVVPRSRVPDMIRSLESISERYDVPIVNFGHAGDGNIHVNVMVDLQKEGMAEKIELVLDEVFQSAIDLDGAISGEHGIGTSKAKYMTVGLSEETINYMKQIKATFDPQNILNPGKMFTN